MSVMSCRAVVTWCCMQVVLAGTSLVRDWKMRSELVTSNQWLQCSPSGCASGQLGPHQCWLAQIAWSLMGFVPLCHCSGGFGQIHALRKADGIFSLLGLKAPGLF